MIGHVSGRPGVECLGPFVRITLHLLVGLAASLELFVCITVDLLASLVTRCSLLLLRRCLEGFAAVWVFTVMPSRCSQSAVNKSS